MNKSKKIIFVVIMLLILTAIGVAIIAISISMTKTNEEKEGNEEKFTIVTSFYPMYIATMNIVDGADVNLKNLSEPKTGCLHDYQLTTEDMKLLSTADVFVVNGGGMEEFLSDVVAKYPKLTVIDSSQGIEIEDDNAHVWMSIKNHIQQVENITKGLCEANPENASIYQENSAKYIDKLNEILNTEDDSLKGNNVMLFSEAYEYLADDFGLEIVGVLDLDEEKDISAGELASTIDIIKSKNVPLIIAEKEYGEKMANAVMKETDAKTIYLNTIIRGDYDKDAYINGMKSNIELLKGALK